MRNLWLLAGAAALAAAAPAAADKGGKGGPGGKGHGGGPAAKVERGAAAITDKDLRVFQGWRWRVLTWTE